MNLQIPDTGLAVMAYLALFIGVLLLFEGLRAWLSRDESLTEARNRRMRLVRRGSSTEEVLTILRDPDAQQQQGRGGPAVRLRRLLRQAGVRISIGVFLLGVAALAAAAFVVALWYLPPELAAASAAAAALALPLLVLVSMKQERAKKLTTQMPDALDLMARSLRIGHPLSTSVQTVAEDMPDPIGSEFGIIHDQVSYGDDMVTAFREFAARVDSEDANYLAVSVGIQHGTGGNLARVLEILAKTIRDRQTMRKKIRAISSEGRLSAVILTLLPVAIFLSIHTSTPTFYGDVQDDPMFRPFVIAIVGLIVFQGLVLRKLVNFKF